MQDPERENFGTGFSSLSRLTRLPVDILKIDRSFVSQIGNAVDDTPVVAGTIALAHGMGLRVVSEGVENATQVEYLVRQGCDELQGFYLGRPVSAAETDELLERSEMRERTGHRALPDVVCAPGCQGVPLTRGNGRNRKQSRNGAPRRSICAR